MKRRDLLRAGAIAGGSLLLPGKWALGKTTNRALNRAFGLPLSPSPGLRKFIQPINGLGPTGIPVASPTTDPNPIPGLAYDYYQIEIGQYFQQLHPDLPKATKLWGYADAAHPAAGGHRYLGGVIVTKKGRPVRMTVTNNLPPVHPLPVDTSIMGAEMGPNRTCVHLHGGLVPWTSDGGPFAWVAPDGTHGASFMNPGPKPGQADHFYPNNQSARLVWYHDHALGTTRLNAYAGIASGYIIRDEFESHLIKAGVIPSAEVPLIIQDKSFKSVADDWGLPGDLWYPSFYDPNKWDLGDGGPPAIPSVVPEFFGDTILVNGAVYPYLDVEPRRYRFRILNGSQARVFNLQLYYADSSGTEADLSKPGPQFIQFGTEGGFLPAPVVLNNPPRQIGFDPVTGNANSYTLLQAPAERADLIIDFSHVPVGSKLVLYNDAPAPFPMGDPINDYSNPGSGPDTRTLMQFRVVRRTGSADPFNFQKTLLALKIALAPLAFDRLLPAFANHVRDLTLNEDFDDFGRLIQKLGTNVQLPASSGFGRNYMDDPTEVVAKGSTEVWRVFNLTGDTHPIHFHLVNCQILSRRPFDALNYNGTPVFTGPARLADPNERGWRETVRINPGEMMSVIMKFDLAKVPFAVPPSPRTGGNEFVWHCHILEHEEHDMMRPLIVK